VARQGRVIAQWLADPALTAVVAVAQPEELPVAETVALAGELRTRLGMELEAVVVNGMAPERFSPAQEAQLRQALPGLDGGASGWALRRALAHVDVARAQRALAQRLAREVGLPPLVLPVAVDPKRGGADLDVLAGAVERAGRP